MTVIRLLIPFIVLFAISVSAQDKPQLSEVEQLKIQIANLQIELRNEQMNASKWIRSYGECQVQLLTNTQPVVSMLQTLDGEIEKNHPGFDFDLKTGVFTPSKVEKPVEKKP